jgi:spermidine/putrescine ABC transporter ATP-binding subunit
MSLGKKGAEVSIKKIAKFYKNVVALNYVSMDIKSGEFITLLGPSGSGKTTLLMCLAGFLEPEEGAILLNGKDISHIPPYKRDIGMVFQDYALFPHMTVLENIEFPLKMRKMPKAEIAERAREALNLVQLEGYGERNISQISGGQRQRVALARAIVYSPTLLLMDEPLGALDRKLRENMQIEIMHLKRKLGITIIYVTHDQTEALVMSDKIAILRNGVIEQIGTPSEIYVNPSDVFVADFLGESSFIDAELQQFNEHGYGVVKLDSGGYMIGNAKKEFKNGERVRCSIRPEQISILSKDSLEEEYVIEGVIDEIIYLGECTKYLITIDSRHQIYAKMINTQYTPRYSVGDHIKVKYNPDMLLLLN